MSYRIPSFSPQLLQNNKQTITNTKVIISIVSGIVTGALGLIHYQGFIFMFLMYLLISVILYIQLKSKSENYFENSSTILTEGFGAFFGTFIFIWTISYSLVYVY